MAIYSAADYPRIVGTIRTLWVALEPYLQLYSRSPENRRAAQAEHHRLIESIRRGDNDVAVGILGAHIRRSQRALLQEPSLGR